MSSNAPTGSTRSSQNVPPSIAAGAVSADVPSKSDADKPATSGRNGRNGKTVARPAAKAKRRTNKRAAKAAPAAAPEEEAADADFDASADGATAMDEAALDTPTDWAGDDASAEEETPAPKRRRASARRATRSADDGQRVDPVRVYLREMGRSRC